jgi:hypothetical protein
MPSPKHIKNLLKNPSQKAQAELAAYLQDKPGNFYKIASSSSDTVQAISADVQKSCPMLTPVSSEEAVILDELYPTDVNTTRIYDSNGSKCHPKPAHVTTGLDIRQPLLQFLKAGLFYKTVSESGNSLSDGTPSLPYDTDVNAVFLGKNVTADIQEVMDCVSASINDACVPNGMSLETFLLVIGASVVVLGGLICIGMSCWSRRSENQAAELQQSMLFPSENVSSGGLFSRSSSQTNIELGSMDEGANYVNDLSIDSNEVDESRSDETIRLA